MLSGLLIALKDLSFPFEECKETQGPKFQITYDYMLIYAFESDIADLMASNVYECKSQWTCIVWIRD